VGSIVLTIPDIPDANLLYDEAETRAILKFFWPDRAAPIDGLGITSGVRALAQTALIAAIDGSYAMGYVNVLWDALTHRMTHPNGDIVALARRLGRNFMRHWWRHATQQDLLQDVRIYETVRVSVARDLRHTLEDYLNGLALRRGSTTVALLTGAGAA
jgi:hypothetical protein